MMRQILMVCGLLALTAVPQRVAGAQAAPASASKADSIPKAHLPPAGMCRIWLDEVPAAQQPAPTDCSLAVRNKPPNGKVVYGPTKGGAGAKPPVKRFESKTKPPNKRFEPKPPIKIPGVPDFRPIG